jgi:hypothetical protein
MVRIARSISVFLNRSCPFKPRRGQGTAKGRRLICEQLGAAGYREPLLQHAESQGFVVTREVNTARLHGAVRKVVPLTYGHESDQQRLDPRPRRASWPRPLKLALAALPPAVPSSGRLRRPTARRGRCSRWRRC